MKQPNPIPLIEDFLSLPALTEMEQQVYNQWDDYDSILSEAKECNKDKIILSQPLKIKGTNKAHYKGNSALRHREPVHELVLGVSQHYSRRNYNIIMRCANAFKKPLIHFDAAGPSHTNAFPEIPLEKRLVTTPHFNRFREDGRYYAYKTSALARAEDAAAIVEDVSFGLALFCGEVNCACADGQFPEATYRDAEMKFPGTLKVNFKNIKFE